MAAGFSLIGKDEQNRATFLGRTGTSWVKILVFYAIYYTLLGLLAWGAILLRQTNLPDPNADDTVPFINTRLPQPGVKVWPQHQAQGKDDDGNMRLKINQWVADSASARPKNNHYADYIELFLLGLTTQTKDNREHLHIDDPKIEGYCKSKSDCKLTNFMPLTTQGVNFIKFKDSNKTAYIDWQVLRDSITDENDRKVITKPFVYLTLNKKTKFDLEEVFIWDAKKGPSPSYDRSTYRADLSGKRTSVGRAYFSCFLMDNRYSSNCETTGTYETCDDAKMGINDIHPYIENKHYRLPTKKTERDNYVSPFAIFQVDPKNNTDFPKGNEFPFRCNTLARNIQYTYRGNSNLEGNQQLKQNGNGHASFGFVRVP